MKKTVRMLIICVAFCLIAVTFLTLVPESSEKVLAGSEPGSMMIFNEQTVNVILGNSYGDYSAYTTQLGIDQTKVSYDAETNSMKLEYQKDNSNPDPKIYLPVRDMFRVNLADYPVFAICYKNNSNRTDGGFYFSLIEGSDSSLSANAPYLTESKYASLDMSNSGKWKITTKNVGAQNHRWTGNIAQIRLDIFGEDYTGEVYIKWIGFFKTEEDAQAFGVNGTYERNKITTDKTTYGRGETITASVANYMSNDWVALVQKGDAVCVDSHIEDNLYFGTCMPLLWAPVENGKITLDMDTCGGVYSGMLLPAGEYDLVYCLRGRYSESYRTTITITENIVREPSEDTKVLVTRAPESEASPTPHYISDDIEPDITLAPVEISTVEEENSSTGVILIVAGILVVLAVCAFIIYKKAKKTKN